MANLFLFLSLSLFFSKNIINNKIPESNAIIVEYVHSVIGEKVGRGECWDLASEALEKADAEWNGKYTYGELLSLKTDTILPGDIIHFTNVKMKYERNDTLFTEKMKNHTAIVYKVKKINQIFTIAEQNTSKGRFVTTSKLEIENIIKGKIKIYRPVKEDEKH